MNSTSDPSPVKPGIDFHFVATVDNFGDLDTYRKWIRNTVEEEEKSLLRIDYIFVSDDQLHTLNQHHLNHDTLTDILTFPYQTNPIEAEIYISVERVLDNARQNEVAFLDELKRVMVHGILHMCGWNDHTGEEKEAMRVREAYFLARWSAT